MNNIEKRDFAIKAVERSKGDDLARARLFWKDLTPKQMQEPYGNSTRAQAMAEWSEWEAKCNETIEWLKSL